MIEIPMVKSDSPNALVAIYLLPVDDFAPNALTRTFRTTSIDDVLKIALELALNSFPSESVQKIVAKVQLDFDVSKPNFAAATATSFSFRKKPDFAVREGVGRSPSKDQWLSQLAVVRFARITNVAFGEH